MSDTQAQQEEHEARQREPSLGGRVRIACTCGEAHRRYQELLEPHRDPSWRMPSFSELSRAEQEYKEQAKVCQVCSRTEGI